MCDVTSKSYGCGLVREVQLDEGRVLDSFDTIFGAAGFWEPTIALGPLTVTELITRRYYSRPLEQRSQTIRLLNAMKVGFYLGIVIDALKLAG